jgi:hypothetical protein
MLDAQNLTHTRFHVTADVTDWDVTDRVSIDIILLLSLNKDVYCTALMSACPCIRASNASGRQCS